jgi:hypothetical protein
MDIKIVKMFESPIIMDNFIKDYLQSYAPAGYGTQVKIRLYQPYTYWEINKVSYEVTIERWESCD